MTDTPNEQAEPAAGMMLKIIGTARLNVYSYKDTTGSTTTGSLKAGTKVHRDEHPKANSRVKAKLEDGTAVFIKADQFTWAEGEVTETPRAHGTAAAHPFR
jgi:hypothetical protein